MKHEIGDVFIYLWFKDDYSDWLNILKLSKTTKEKAYFNDLSWDSICVLDDQNDDELSLINTTRLETWSIL
jgi:hypothetical protein